MVYTDRFISWLEEVKKDFEKHREVLSPAGEMGKYGSLLTEVIEGIGTLQKEKGWNK